MGVRKMVRVACDYGWCDDTYDADGNATIIGTWQKAEAAGWVRRGVFVLCPVHADVEEIVR